MHTIERGSWKKRARRCNARTFHSVAPTRCRSSRSSLCIYRTGCDDQSPTGVAGYGPKATNAGKPEARWHISRTAQGTCVRKKLCVCGVRRCGRPDSFCLLSHDNQAGEHSARQARRQRLTALARSLAVPRSTGFIFQLPAMNGTRAIIWHVAADDAEERVAPAPAALWKTLAGATKADPAGTPASTNREVSFIGKGKMEGLLARKWKSCTREEAWSWEWRVCQISTEPPKWGFAECKWIKQFDYIRPSGEGTRKNSKYLMWVGGSCVGCTKRALHFVRSFSCVWLVRAVSVQFCIGKHSQRRGGGLQHGRQGISFRGCCVRVCLYPYPGFAGWLRTNGVTTA